MPRNEFKFDAALPHPIRWSVGENKYDTEGDWPSHLGLQIPTESITPFCNYLMSLLDEEGKISTGKVWDHDKKAEVEVDVSIISSIKLSASTTVPSRDFIFPLGRSTIPYER